MVLTRQQRCGANQRDLMTGHGGGKGGAQRNLGLAKADIAANQPVHRRALGQVAKHIVDRAVLIIGFLIGEAVDEFVEAAIGFNDVGGL